MPPKRGVKSLPSNSRRKPFSIKQKKLQLQQKRHRKRDKDDDSRSFTPSAEDGGDERGEGSSTETGSEGEAVAVSKLNLQPHTSEAVAGDYDPNRYKLHFQRESAEEIERRKHKAQCEPLTSVPESDMEVSVEDVYRPGSVLDIPRRPPWSYSMTKQQLDQQEESAFQDYLSRIHSNHRPHELSLFEHNLETWRQLWRVLEISDVVLFITDVRHPTLHFSPALYTHVVDHLKKEIVLVLNKVDLVPPQVAVAWRHYFISKFPQLKVICFTCFPDHHLTTTTAPLHSDKVSMKPRKRVRGTLPCAVGAQELFKIVEDMFAGKADLTGWKQKLRGGERDQSVGDDVRVVGEGGGGDSGLDSSDSDHNTSARQHSAAGQSSSDTVDTSSSPPVAGQRREDEASARPDTNSGMITIGMVGHPNVGKSSILNGLMGKKMVSTSRTPGHTKHFQTIFLSQSVRLCDCPGLVFPSLVNKQLQILSGMYPVAQVREPYTAVGYLAERSPLVSLLRLQHPDHEGERRNEGREEEEIWTAWNVCEAWAQKRHFFTSKAARLDTYRAANNILRLAVEGRVCMYFRPPGYSSEKDKWEAHPEVKEMIELQRQGLTRSRSSDKWEAHPEVKEMIELQRQGLTRSRSSGSNIAVAPSNELSDPEDSEGREEEGWESGDEGRWSSEGGEKGKKRDKEGTSVQQST